MHGEEAETYIILAVGYGCQTNKANYLTNGKLCKITKNKNIILHFYSTPSLDAGDITTPYIDKKYDIFIK